MEVHGSHGCGRLKSKAKSRIVNVTEEQLSSTLLARLDVNLEVNVQLAQCSGILTLCERACSDPPPRQPPRGPKVIGLKHQSSPCVNISKPTTVPDRPDNDYSPNGLSAYSKMEEV